MMEYEYRSKFRAQGVADPYPDPEYVLLSINLKFLHKKKSPA
jgi:hypothetical protein